jgi:serine/threonine protein kinase
MGVDVNNALRASVPQEATSMPRATVADGQRAGQTADPAAAAGQAGSGARLIGERYRLVSAIGSGSMGTVWRAWDELLDRNVAIKEVRLPGDLSPAERAGMYQRTMREARSAARLSHRAVAAVYDVVEESGHPWIVMELVDGRSLDSVLKSNGPLAPKRAAQIGCELLAALTAAHDAGVLHRDVKPANVLLTHSGNAVLTDFGVAAIDGDPALTQAGMVVGTPAFMAPERVRGEEATPAADLWSLGATLYAAVEGQGPYDHCGSGHATMAAIATEDPAPPKVTGPLAEVISGLLSRDPARRPIQASAMGMLEAAASAAAAMAAHRRRRALWGALRLPKRTRFARWRAAAWAAAAAGGLACLALTLPVSPGSLLGLHRDPARPPTDRAPAVSLPLPAPTALPSPVKPPPPPHMPAQSAPRPRPTAPPAASPAPVTVSTPAPAPRPSSFPLIVMTDSQTGLCLNGSTGNVSTSACLGTVDPDQTWEFVGSLIKNEQIGRCLAINSSSPSDASPGTVFTLPCSSADSLEQWKLVLASASGASPVTWNVVNVQTDRCLDSNEQGSVYNLPCNGDGDNYQNWLRAQVGMS